MAPPYSLNAHLLANRLSGGSSLMFVDRSFVPIQGGSIIDSFLRLWTARWGSRGLTMFYKDGTGTSKVGVQTNTFAFAAGTATQAAYTDASTVTGLTSGFLDHNRGEYVASGNAAQYDADISWTFVNTASPHGTVDWGDRFYNGAEPIIARSLQFLTPVPMALQWQGYNWAGCVGVTWKPGTDNTGGSTTPGELVWKDLTTAAAVANPALNIGVECFTPGAVTELAGDSLIHAGVRFWAPGRKGLELASMTPGAFELSTFTTTTMSDNNMALFAQAMQLDTIIIWPVDTIANPATYAATVLAYGQRWVAAINAARAIDTTIKSPIIVVVLTAEFGGYEAIARANFRAMCMQQGWVFLDLYSMMYDHYGPLARWAGTYTVSGADYHPNQAGADLWMGWLRDEIISPASAGSRRTFNRYRS